MIRVRKETISAGVTTSFYMDQDGGMCLEPWPLIAADIHDEIRRIRSTEGKPETGITCAGIYCEWKQPGTNHVNHEAFDSIPDVEQITKMLEEGKRIHAESNTGEKVCLTWDPDDETLCKTYGARQEILVYHQEEDEESNLSVLEALKDQLGIACCGFDPEYDDENKSYIRIRQQIEALEWAVRQLKK